MAQIMALILEYQNPNQLSPMPGGRDFHLLHSTLPRALSIRWNRLQTWLIPRTFTGCLPHPDTNCRRLINVP